MRLRYVFAMFCIATPSTFKLLALMVSLKVSWRVPSVKFTENANSDGLFVSLTTCATCTANTELTSVTPRPTMSRIVEFLMVMKVLLMDVPRSSNCFSSFKSSSLKMMMISSWLGVAE